MYKRTNVIKQIEGIRYFKRGYSDRWYSEKWCIAVSYTHLTLPTIYSV